MVNNSKQLRERHCTSIIQLIKQSALKKNCWSLQKQREFLLTKIKMKIGIILSLIYTESANKMYTNLRKICINNIAMLAKQSEELF